MIGVSDKFNWKSLSDAEFSKLLRNCEGRNELERAIILEAAKRIDERAAAIRIMSEDQSK